MFNFFTSQNGAEIYNYQGVEEAGIVGVLDGTVVLPSEDPFEAFFKQFIIIELLLFVITYLKFICNIAKINTH